MRTSKLFAAGLISLAGIHALLLGLGAVRLSPVNDEVAHLTAGLHQWEYFEFGLYRVNPPLVKLVAALPVRAAGYEADWSYVDLRPGHRSAWNVGRVFSKLNGRRSFWLYVLARWACIPFSLLGLCVCGFWARSLFGDIPGLFAAGLWCFSPTVIGNAMLFTPDMHSGAVGLAAAYAFWLYLKQPSWTRVLAAGLAFGLMQLTKLTWIIAFGLWPILWAVVRLGAVGMTGKRWLVEFAQLAAILLLGLFVLNAGYAFEGTFQRLGEHEFVSASLTNKVIDANRKNFNEPGNRFRGTWLGDLPLPVPSNWLLGIDVQRRDFETDHEAYLGGTWKDGGWWYYYLAAVMLKAPVGLLVLGAMALGFRLGGGGIHWRDELILLIPALAVFVLVSSQTALNHHFRYVTPCFGFAFVWIAQLARVFSEQSRLIKVLVGLAGLEIVAVSLWVWPFSSTFFNLAVGGPQNGYRYLSHSAVDWGQGLLELEKWIREHPDCEPLYTDLITRVDSSLFDFETRMGRLPLWEISASNKPAWIAISAAELARYRYNFLRSMQPVAFVGGTIFIFHVTPEDTAAR